MLFYFQKINFLLSNQYIFFSRNSEILFFTVENCPYQRQYVICADGTEMRSFEFFVPKEDTEGGETSGEQTGEGETSGETNA